MKKILFVTSNFPPNQSIGTQRILKFIKYLSLNGWQIYVITLKEHYFENNIENYDFLRTNNIKIFRTHKLDIFRYWAKYKSRKATPESKIQNGKDFSVIRRKGILYNLKEFITQLLQYPDKQNGWVFSVFIKTFLVLKKYKIPIVFVSSPPHSTYLPVNFLHKLLKFKYIADFRDPWAHSQWENKFSTLYENFENKLDLFFERITIKSADKILFNTPLLKKEYLNYYNKDLLDKKSSIISNGYDPELLIYYGGEKAKTTSQKDRVTIIHMGTLYKKRDPKLIIDALAEMRNNNPQMIENIKLKFFGNITNELLYLKTYVKEKNLTANIEFLSSIPYKMAIDEMQKSDWLMILQPGTKIQIPAKFFDYLLINRPIWGIVESDGISAKLIKDINVGIVSDCASKQSIIDFFNFILLKQKINFMPNQHELEKYALPNLVKQLEKSIESV